MPGSRRNTSMRRRAMMGTITGAPANVNTKYVYGSGVGALSRSARAYQQRRAAFCCINKSAQQPQSSQQQQKTNQTLADILSNGNSAGTNEIDMSSNKIINCADPIDHQDVATKHYVDTYAQPKGASNGISAVSAGRNIKITTESNSNIPIVSLQITEDVDFSSKQITRCGSIVLTNSNYNERTTIAPDNFMITGNPNTSDVEFFSQMYNNRFIIQNPAGNIILTPVYLINKDQDFTIGSGKNLSLTSTNNGNISLNPSNKNVDVMGALNVHSNKIINCADPTDNKDVATKNYVDSRAPSSLAQVLTAGAIANNNINMNNNDIVSAGNIRGNILDATTVNATTIVPTNITGWDVKSIVAGTGVTVTNTSGAVTINSINSTGGSGTTYIITAPTSTTITTPNFAPATDLTMSGSYTATVNRTVTLSSYVANTAYKLVSMKGLIPASSNPVLDGTYKLNQHVNYTGSQPASLYAKMYFYADTPGSTYLINKTYSSPAGSGSFQVINGASIPVPANDLVLVITSITFPQVNVNSGNAQSPLVCTVVNQSGTVLYTFPTVIYTTNGNTNDIVFTPLSSPQTITVTSAITSFRFVLTNTSAISPRLSQATAQNVTNANYSVGTGSSVRMLLYDGTSNKTALTPGTEAIYSLPLPLPTIPFVITDWVTPYIQLDEFFIQPTGIINGVAQLLFNDDNLSNLHTTVTSIPTLAQVLMAGSSAGETDIHMNSKDIINAGNIGVGNINASLTRTDTLVATTIQPTYITGWDVKSIVAGTGVTVTNNSGAFTINSTAGSGTLNPMAYVLPFYYEQTGLNYKLVSKVNNGNNGGTTAEFFRGNITPVAVSKLYNPEAASALGLASNLIEVEVNVNWTTYVSNCSPSAPTIPLIWHLQFQKNSEPSPYSELTTPCVVSSILIKAPILKTIFSTQQQELCNTTANLRGLIDLTGYNPIDTLTFLLMCYTVDDSTTIDTTPSGLGNLGTVNFKSTMYRSSS